MNLSERKLKILSSIVETYLQTGEPVGSKHVSASLLFEVSPATIRNDMSELSGMGLLVQPHTSAGRIPSATGYRVYVDHLIGKPPLSRDESDLIDDMLSGREDPEGLLVLASEALAHLTKMAAISTPPHNETAVVAKIEIIPAGRRTAAILLFTGTGIVKTRYCRTEEPLTPELLKIFSETVSKMCGMRLCDITIPYIQTLAVSAEEDAFAVTSLLLGVYASVREASEVQIQLTGQENLLMLPEFTGPKARDLIGFLRHKDRLVSILTGYREGLRVFIGDELGKSELSDSSVILTDYKVPGKNGGIIGVIGPIRMNYAKMISSLEYFSNRLGKLLSEALDDD